MKGALTAAVLAFALFAAAGPAEAVSKASQRYVDASLALMNLGSCSGTAASTAHAALSRRFDAIRQRAIRRGKAAMVRKADAEFRMFIASALFIRCAGGPGPARRQAEQAVAGLERVPPF